MTRAMSFSAPWPARLLLLALPALLAAFAGVAAVGSPGSFGEVVHDLRIELSADSVAALKSNPRSYVHARVQADGQAWPEVAIHLKGATGSFRPLDDKPGLTLDFDRFVRGRDFLGMTKVHLNNSVEDPSYLCELIGGELFRAAGIPAAGTGHAVVHLNGRRLGLYVLQEGFDREFLKRELPGAEGVVLEPARGQDVDGLMQAHAQRGSPPPDGALEALAAAAQETDPTKRWERLSAVLDMDRFIRFMAVEVMIGHRDGYSLAKNNFRVLLPSPPQRAVFLPQGMDQLFQIADVPWEPNLAGLVARAVLDTPQGRQRYEESFATLLPALLQFPRLSDRIDAVSARLCKAATWSESAELRQEAALLKEHVRLRAAALDRQLKSSSRPLADSKNLPLLPPSARVSHTHRDQALEFADHATY